MPSLEDTSHLLLTAGRLLLANGAETESVQRFVEQLGELMGYSDVRCAITYEDLLLTLDDGSRFRTRLGRHIAGLAVNMAVVTELNRLLRECQRDPLALQELPRQLEQLEHPSAQWSNLAVVLLVGLTAASLSRLSGGDWPAFPITWLAASLGMIVRIRLGQAQASPNLIPFCAAWTSCLIAGLASAWSRTPVICLVAPCMVIVPGVPLVNSVLDLVKNHLSLGLCRIAQGLLALAGISLGLLAATGLTRSAVPIELRSPTPDLGEVVLFGALSALGYAALFNISRRLVGGCALCGGLSLALRAGLLEQGLELPLATFMGALLVGFVAHWMAARWQVPPALFAYPGVVAMVPGSLAFRGSVGLLRIASEGAAVPPSVLAETLSLGISILLLVGAIALGLALPTLLAGTVSPRARVAHDG